MQRFPTEGYLVLHDNIKEDLKQLISVQIRHNEIGDHSIWITSTIQSIVQAAKKYDT